MKQTIFLTKFISVGQKTADDSTAYGRGFNYWVEVGFTLDQEFDRPGTLRAIGNALSLIDHKALGVDVKLDFEPTTARLCAWLTGKIKANSVKLISVSMKRGDGLTLTTRCPSVSAQT